VFVPFTVMLEWGPRDRGGKRGDRRAGIAS
jgi:hypothetical protein